MVKNKMISELIIILIESFIIYFAVSYSISSSFRMGVFNNLMRLVRVRNPYIDGSRIFIIGNTFRRKFALNFLQLYIKETGSVPAGCYIRDINEMVITKYALYTDGGIDTYCTQETIMELVGIISHEFMHMLLTLEHGEKESIMFDNLYRHTGNLGNNGMEDWIE